MKKASEIEVKQKQGEMREIVLRMVFRSLNPLVPLGKANTFFDSVYFELLWVGVVSLVTQSQLNNRISEGSNWFWSQADLPRCSTTTSFESVLMRWMKLEPIIQVFLISILFLYPLMFMISFLLPKGLVYFFFQFYLDVMLSCLLEIFPLSWGKFASLWTSLLKMLFLHLTDIWKVVFSFWWLR